jgi:hypothetical protein
MASTIYRGTTQKVLSTLNGRIFNYVQKRFLVFRGLSPFLCTCWWARQIRGDTLSAVGWWLCESGKAELMSDMRRRHHEQRYDFLVSNQCDQMSSRKSRPNCCPTHYISILTRNRYHGKWNPKESATFVILTNLLEVNNHPLGENSPNLVTLFQPLPTCCQCFLKSNISIFFLHKYVSTWCYFCNS